MHPWRLLSASMLYDLVISRGEEEIEKPDLTVVFYTDIAASCVPVYANQTWSFLHMILSTGSQSLVNFVPVSPTVFYLHVYPFYVYWSMFFAYPNIEHLCHTDCFVAFILNVDFETSLVSLYFYIPSYFSDFLSLIVSIIYYFIS